MGDVADGASRTLGSWIARSLTPPLRRGVVQRVSATDCGIGEQAEPVRRMTSHLSLGPHQSDRKTGWISDDYVDTRRDVWNSPGTARRPRTGLNPPTRLGMKRAVCRRG